MARRSLSPLVSFLILSAFLLSACEFQRGSNSPTSPSATPVSGGGTITSLKGRWIANVSGGLANAASQASSPTATATDLGPAVCSNLIWNANDVQDDGTVQGVFTAICIAGYHLSGSATGTLSGSTVTVTATGVGDVNDTACPFTITSTGAIEGEQIRFPYVANTCLGTFSGTTYLARSELPIASPASPAACSGSTGDNIVECVESQYPDRLAAGVSHATRVANMEFLRDRIIERGRCKGLDLAWNLKRGTGPRSTDALAWRTGGNVEVVDVGVGYDDTSQPLHLQWLVVAGPPGYETYTPSFSCN